MYDMRIIDVCLVIEYSQYVSSLSPLWQRSSNVYGKS